MPDKSQLPHLIKLIDDESEVVRTEVLKGLGAYGISLEEDLMEFSNEINSETFEMLTPILMANRREIVTKQWFEWQLIDNEYDKLEAALDLIAKYQLGFIYENKLKRILDSISEDFKNKYLFGNEIDLATFIFQHIGIKGDKDDYYNPLNSNVIYALENKKGLPITLASIYILLGYRLGLNVEGCNFPGHFLAKIELDNETILVDCFNGGKLLYEKDITANNTETKESIDNLISMKTDSQLIVRRVVNNLITAYKNKHDETNSLFFKELLALTN